MKSTDIGTKRILVVEDEPAICEICITVLSKEGFRVDTVANNKLAEDKIKKEDYDLILVDIKTPVMNGKELYQSIIDNFPEMAGRVIFTTGDVMAESTETFIRKSGRPFLSKPYTPEELSEIVNETLNQLEG
jgi:DNA-binding response OmpR family regulator